MQKTLSYSSDKVDYVCTFNFTDAIAGRDDGFNPPEPATPAHAELTAIYVASDPTKTNIIGVVNPVDIDFLEERAVEAFQECEVN